MFVVLFVKSCKLCMLHTCSWLYVRHPNAVFVIVQFFANGALIFSWMDTLVILQNYDRFDLPARDCAFHHTLDVLLICVICTAQTCCSQKPYMQLLVNLMTIKWRSSSIASLLKLYQCTVLLLKCSTATLAAAQCYVFQRDGAVEWSSLWVVITSHISIPTIKLMAVMSAFSQFWLLY